MSLMQIQCNASTTLHDDLSTCSYQVRICSIHKSMSKSLIFQLASSQFFLVSQSIFKNDLAQSGVNNQLFTKRFVDFSPLIVNRREFSRKICETNFNNLFQNRNAVGRAGNKSNLGIYFDVILICQKIMTCHPTARGSSYMKQISGGFQSSVKMLAIILFILGEDQNLN